MKLLLGALVLVGSLAVLGITHRSQAARPVASPVDLRIERLVRQYAKGMGNHPVQVIDYVAARRRAANVVASGEGVDSNEAVFLVAVRGRFVDYEASTPFGAALPRGRVLTLVMTRSDLSVTDLGVGDRWPHLARLGRVHVLHP